MGVSIHCSSASALCQTGNNDGKSWNFPSYLYQREIQPVEPVGLERSDFEEQQENSGKQDEKEDGTLEYDSPNDDDDILSLEREADFYLGKVSASEEVFASTAESCSVDFFLSPLLRNYGIAVTFCVLYTC